MAGEVADEKSAPARQEMLRKEVAAREQEWRQALDLGDGETEAALELLAAARVAGAKALAEEVTSFLASDSNTTTELALSLTELTSARPDPEIDPGRLVGLSRRRARFEPRNALAWSELARGRLLLGDTEQAMRALDVARALAPTDRTITRSYVRLLVHLHEHDRAHAVVREHPNLQGDPWLQATEIASAELAESPPLSMSKARAALTRGEWHLREASELSAAVATAEFAAGNSKTARAFMRLGVKGEHDNALAQAEDLSRKGLRIASANLEQTLYEHPLAFEARAQRAYVDHDWEGAWAEGVGWQDDQGFSSLPARFLTLVAAVGLADPERSIQAARRGLAANPKHPVLLNNAAFALLILGQVAEAETLLGKIDSAGCSVADQAAIKATNGLLAYRQGHDSLGALRYEEAAEMASGNGEIRVAVAAQLYHEWIRTELGLPVAHGDRATVATPEPSLRVLRRRINDRSLPLSPVQSS